MASNSNLEDVHLFLTPKQKLAWSKNQSFQLSSKQLKAREGKHYVSLGVNGSEMKRLISNTKNNKGHRFKAEHYSTGGDLSHMIKGAVETVKKVVNKGKSLYNENRDLINKAVDVGKSVVNKVTGNGIIDDIKATPFVSNIAKGVSNLGNNLVNSALHTDIVQDLTHIPRHFGQHILNSFGINTSKMSGGSILDRVTKLGALGAHTLLGGILHHQINGGEPLEDHIRAVGEHAKDLLKQSGVKLNDIKNGLVHNDIINQIVPHLHNAINGGSILSKMRDAFRPSNIRKKFEEVGHTLAPVGNALLSAGKAALPYAGMVASTVGKAALPIIGSTVAPLIVSAAMKAAGGSLQNTKRRAAINNFNQGIKTLTDGCTPEDSKGRALCRRGKRGGSFAALGGSFAPLGRGLIV